MTSSWGVIFSLALRQKWKYQQLNSNSQHTTGNSVPTKNNTGVITCPLEQWGSHSEEPGIKCSLKVRPVFESQGKRQMDNKEKEFIHLDPEITSFAFWFWNNILKYSLIGTKVMCGFWQFHLNNCNSVVECLTSMCKALGSIPSTID